MKPLFALLAVLLLCSSCALNAQFVSAVDSAWSVIGPEYIEYVQADPNLRPDTKETRIRTATLLTETIAEAKQ